MVSIASEVAESIFAISNPAHINFSKSTIEVPEQCVKSVEVNIKVTFSLQLYLN